jgi:hypothetical protein
MTEHSDAWAVGDHVRIRARHGWIACVVENSAKVSNIEQRS